MAHMGTVGGGEGGIGEGNFCEQWPLEATEAWEHILLRSLSSNLSSYVTSRLFGGHHGLRGHQNSNMHNYTRVIKADDFKPEVKIGL